MTGRIQEVEVDSIDFQSTLPYRNFLQSSIYYLITTKSQIKGYSL